MSTATLRLYTPMPNARPFAESRFSTNETSFRITTSTERGMESCEIGFPVIDQGRRIYPWLTEPIYEYRDFAHVTVTTGDKQVLFQGRASASPIYAGGVIRGVTARGYWDALNDRHFDSGTAFVNDALDSTTGAIIRAVLLQGTSFVEIDDMQWTDPSVVHKPNEFDEQSCGSIVDSLLREGGTDGTIYDLQFWPGPNGVVQARLVARTAPSVPDYECDWPNDTQLVNVTHDQQQRISHLRGHYTDTADSTVKYTGWQPALSDNSFEDAYGIRREVTIQLGQTTTTGAEQLRDTQQALLSLRQWGGEINISPSFRLTVPGSDMPVRTQIVRAGQWLYLRGLRDPDAVLLLIQRCVYDYATDRAQLTVTRGMTRRGLMQRIVETTDASRASRNPISGARA